MIVNWLFMILKIKAPVVIDLGYGYGTRPINKWLIDNVGAWKSHKFHPTKNTHSTTYGHGWRVHEQLVPGEGCRTIVEIADERKALLFRLWV